MTNDGESTFDTSPEHPPPGHGPKKPDPRGDSDSVLYDPSMLVVADQKEISPAPPSEDPSPTDLELLKQQGAIPKHYSRPQQSASVEEDSQGKERFVGQ